MPNKSSQRSQYFAAFAASFGAMAQSAAVNWARPDGPQIINNFTLTDEQISGLSSTLAFTASSMCILTGFLANFMGRRTAMLLLVIPFTVGWTLILIAQNFTMVIMGRALLGISSGGICAIVPIYIGEIAETKNRGRLGYLFQLLSIVGAQFVPAVDSKIYTREMTLACAVIPLVFGVLILFCPESPTYLNQKKRRGDTARALLRLGGKKYNPFTELNGIEFNGIELNSIELNKSSIPRPLEQREQQQENKEQQQTPKKEMWLRLVLSCRKNKFQLHQYKEVFKPLLRRSSMKALLISYGLFICQQMCGINILNHYTKRIFAIAGMQLAHLNSLNASIGVAAVVFSGLIVDRIGRRILLLASQIVVIICFLSLGYYVRTMSSSKSMDNSGYLNGVPNANSMDNLNRVPLGILCAFTFAFSIGLGPIPWVIVGEIFPTDVKCLAGSISTAASLTLAFVTTKTFESLNKVFDLDGVLFLYASFTLLGIVFVYFVVPETKGKSLNSIQQIINEDTNVPADPDGLVESSDNIAIKQQGDCHKRKFFTL